MLADRQTYRQRKGKTKKAQDAAYPPHAMLLAAHLHLEAVATNDSGLELGIQGQG